tara:strand:- start:45 stop:260 length:216 start_codon:yes stop_codon:yes gene_type:complete
MITDALLLPHKGFGDPDSSVSLLLVYRDGEEDTDGGRELMELLPILVGVEGGDDLRLFLPPLLPLLLLRTI